MNITVVVMVHTAVTYSGIGLWYYVENRGLDIGSWIFFGSFLAIAQPFDMSFLFMLAGYFIPGSFDGKGPSRFVKDRLFRLGIPLVIYIFVVHPIAVALLHPEVNIFDYVMNGVKTFALLDWTSPLWFVLALMIFTGIYVMARIAWGHLATKPQKIDGMKPLYIRSIGNNYPGFGLINRLSI